MSVALSKVLQGFLARMNPLMASLQQGKFDAGREFFSQLRTRSGHVKVVHHYEVLALITVRVNATLVLIYDI